MYTKTCNKCGWVYSASDPRKTCTFCGGHFNEGYCKECGEYATDIVYGTGSRSTWGMCKKCARAKTAKQVAQVDIAHRNRAKQEYQQWKEKIATLPFRPLTEEEWLQAVDYFNGCAACGAEAVEARGFFIAVKEGGKYAVWNVIPLCEKCATRLRKNPNPFETLDPRINDALYAKKRGNNLLLLNNIRNYLERKIFDELHR